MRYGKQIVVELADFVKAAVGRLQPEGPFNPPRAHFDLVDAAMRIDSIREELFRASETMRDDLGRFAVRVAAGSTSDSSPFYSSAAVDVSRLAGALAALDQAFWPSAFAVLGPDAVKALREEYRAACVVFSAPSPAKGGAS